MGAPFVEQRDSAAMNLAQAYFEKARYRQFLDMLNQGGLDIVHLGGILGYQQMVPGDYQLPDFGREDALAILIGNSRALWPPFTLAYQNQKKLQSSLHPLNLYTFELIESAADVLGGQQARRYVFDGPPKQVAFQKLCDAIDLAPMSAAHLNIHPRFGPWFALRGVLVFDKEWISSDLTSPHQEHPCAPCSKRCRAAFDDAMAEPHAIEAWLDLRRQCPVGQNQAYGPMQMRYHYFKDRSAIQIESPES